MPSEQPVLPGIPEDDENPLAGLGSVVPTYLKVRRNRELFAKEEDGLKKEVMEGLAEVEPDENGHRFYTLPAPINGIAGVKRERRVSQPLDEEAALTLVKKYGLEQSCLEVITVLNEDGLLAANFDGVIPDDEFKAVYSESESFALVMVKE